MLATWPACKFVLLLFYSVNDTCVVHKYCSLRDRAVFCLCVCDTGHLLMVSATSPSISPHIN